MRILQLIAIGTLGCLAGYSADWLADGGDPQRTSWQKDEKILSPATVKNMKLLWKVKLDNKPREMHSLFPPVIVGSAATSTGPKEIAVVAGSSDNLYAIDVAKGTIIWNKHFDSGSLETAGGRGGGTFCPGGITGTPVIAPGSAPGKYTLYVASWDGSLHQLNVADGEDLAPPAKFMPANGKPYSLNLANGVIYTSTAQGCGGNPNLIYAYDLATHKVGTFSPGSGSMWGRKGIAVGADGAVYTGTGDGQFHPENGALGMAIIGVKQDPATKALALSDYYGPSNAEWLLKKDLDLEVTPVIFNYKGRELLVSSSKECRLWLLDTKSLGGDDHRTPVYRTPIMCNEQVNMNLGVWGAMSTWEDSKGTRWIVTPFWGPLYTGFHAPVEYGPVTHGAVAAFKLKDTNGQLSLDPAWISRDMNQADPPVIANGVVFGYGSGESATLHWPDPAHISGTAGRIAESTHAVLYALDAQTGKELWSSGDQIASWNHFSGISVANGRVYIGTYDGYEYCFGIAK